MTLLRKFGENSLTIKIGELTFRFDGLGQPYFDKFRERYAHYVVDGGEADFLVEIFKGEDFYLEEDFSLLKLVEGKEDGRNTLLGNNFKGYAVMDGRGNVHIPPLSTVNSFLTAIENYFRWIVAYELVKKGGFILHSSGAVKNGEAHIFFGNSGDGKSTIASFCEYKGAKILSDDLVIVFPKDGKFHAIGAAFWGVLSQEKKDKYSYPVRRCYRIRKSEETAIGGISKAKALGLIIPNCYYIQNHDTISKIVLPAVLRFLDTVSFSELFFRKDDSFWALL